MPEGADCVVPYEETTRDAATMTVSSAANGFGPSNAIHRRGSDHRVRRCVTLRRLSDMILPAHDATCRRHCDIPASSGVAPSQDPERRGPNPPKTSQHTIQNRRRGDGRDRDVEDAAIPKRSSRSPGSMTVATRRSATSTCVRLGEAICEQYRPAVVFEAQNQESRRYQGGLKQTPVPSNSRRCAHCCENVGNISATDRCECVTLAASTTSASAPFDGTATRASPPA